MADQAPLGPDEVRVWCARLDWPGDIGRFESSLSADEKQRAGQFRFDRDRKRFVVRRAALRAVLAESLGVPPHTLRFSYGTHGKPDLSAACNPRRLRFNASHSQDLAVVALAVDRDVGVDVERLKPLDDYEAVARRHFTEGENRALLGVAPSERLHAFFNCWTRKEAFVKARGEGLSLPLDAFEVSLAPDEPAGLLSCAQAGERERWSLDSFDPAPGFVGAVAAAGSGWTIGSRRWEPGPG